MMAVSIKDEDGNINLGAIADSEYLVHFPLFQLPFTVDVITDQNLDTEMSLWLKMKSSNV